MKAQEIRQKFLDFFQEKGHQIVPSAPLVVKNDPTLMFTNAGMNQFKDYFLGNKTAPSPRIADTQKCLRVSGKHNDLEDVGMDTYHHTMFEMLGNWSFGDYFKKEAIEWAWELLTEVYQLPKDRLYVTVFEGNAEDGLEPDQEAYNIWKNIVPEERIIFASKKDNFWEMGDTGPCGPCSEIHIDIRPAEELAKQAGRALVNQDNPLVIEIWNLVFIQFNRKADKSLETLPAKHVDTGMGFERLAMAVQGKYSNYDTDVFQPMIQLIAEKATKTYGKDRQVDIAIRVIADHIRAISFAIADGQAPSNNKAGYVIRRILRRALRYGYTYLGFEEPFLYGLVSTLATQFADVFPELKAQEDFVAQIILNEEEMFLRTLVNGLKRLEEVTQDMKPGENIDGEVVFRLYDTFGFPKDLTALIAKERSLGIDEEGFEAALQIQKGKGKDDAKKETGDWIILHEIDDTEYLAYDTLDINTSIARYRPVKIKDKTVYQLVLDRTPFYAESGGQVGDTGYLVSQDGTLKIPITDTKKENDLIVHFTPKDDFTKLEHLSEVEFTAIVDAKKRHLTENNHSATHLLHAALRQILGPHVSQKGSLVNEKLLRFDFSHSKALSPEELTQTEHIVNQKIRENIALDERRNVPFKKATEELNATGLFGEKYGEFVRVITFDENFSRELCGGTHVPSTGKIGLFKIISESSSAAGIRRIEAITAEEAENYIQSQLQILDELKEMFKQPKDLKKAVESLIQEKNALQKELEKLEGQQVQELKKELLTKIEQVGEINFINQKVALPSVEALRQLAFDLKNEQQNLVAVLAANIKGKPQVGVMISDNLIAEKNLHAGNIIKELAKEIQGGGGGQAFFATAGGKDLNGLDKVIEKAKGLLS
ncbi:MAG: alanine--tRNA ligase [Microscillaceae bacterium]|nr:alanine--tRNA ligase [Microscillaceae bacterium]